LINITACDSTSSNDNNDVLSKNLLALSFSAEPFFDVDESTVLENSQISARIAQIPTDKYEEYPMLHNIPLSATLYKNGEVIAIDITDSRLIGLMNLYNNSVYYNQYAYTQGLLSAEFLNSNVLSEDFRLELTFRPNNQNTEHPYDTNIQSYDTFIVTNEWVVIIDHDSLGYVDQKDVYPFRAIGHRPLFFDYSWLELFEF